MIQDSRGTFPWLERLGELLVLTAVALCLAGSLTINHADGIGFFLLVLWGLISGFSYGFMRGIGTREKWFLFVLASVFLVAVLSIECGTLTRAGFRFMGRDLRWLLAIPVYIAIRRSRLSYGMLGWIFAVSAGLAAAVAFIQVATGAIRPVGVTGVAIVFGNLALLSGVLGCSILWTQHSRRQSLNYLGGAVALMGGLFASFLSGARGGWVALPVLAFFSILMAKDVRADRARSSRLPSYFGVSVLVLVCLTLGVASIFSSPAERIAAIYRPISLYLHDEGDAARISRIRCPNHSEFLRTLKQTITVAPRGTRSLDWLRLDPHGGPSGQGCPGQAAFTLHVPVSYNPTTSFRVPGSYLVHGPERMGILAKGHALFETKLGVKSLTIRSRHWKPYYLYGHQHLLYLQVHPGWQVSFVPLLVPRNGVMHPAGSRCSNRPSFLRQLKKAFIIFAPPGNWLHVNPQGGPRGPVCPGKAAYSVRATRAVLVSLRLPAYKMTYGPVRVGMLAKGHAMITAKWGAKPITVQTRQWRRYYDRAEEPGRTLFIQMRPGWRVSFVPLQLPHGGGAHSSRGRCTNSVGWMRKIKQTVQVSPDTGRGWLHLAHLRSPLALGCSGRSTLSIRVPADQSRWVLAEIPESYLSGGLSEVGVLAKGHALLVPNAGAKPVEIHSAHWKPYYALGIYQRAQYFELRLKPGWRVSFVPLQLRYGSLSYAPFANSIDERFEMWHAAWRMFASHPFLGVGFGDFQNDARTLVHEERIDPTVADYDHAHNDFLNVLATMGLVGILALLAVYFYPLFAFFRPKATNGLEQRLTARCGAMVVCSFVVFGLTETMFIHTLVIIWYIVALSSFVALSRGKERVI